MSFNSMKQMADTLQNEWERQQTRLHSSSGKPKATMKGGKPSKSELDEMMEDLTQQIAVLESRLQVSNTVAQFLEQRAKQAQEEKRANEIKAAELLKQLETLKHKQSQEGGGRSVSSSDKATVKALEKRLQECNVSLQEKDELIANLEQKCTQQRKQIEQLQKQVGETEEKLNTSYIATLDELTGQIRELQEDLKESQEAAREAELVAEQAVAAYKASENGGSTAASGAIASLPGNDTFSRSLESQELERKYVELESKLALTTKVAEFLQKKMVTTEGERDARIDEVNQLQAKLAEVKEECMDMVRQVEIKASDLDFKLHNTKRMLRFAEGKAQKAEAVANKTRIELSQEVRDFKNKYITQQRMAKFMERKITTVQDEKAKKEAQLDAKIFDLEFKLSGKQRVCKFMETNLEKTAVEKKKLQDKMKDLKAELEGQAEALENLKKQAENDRNLAVGQEAKINELTPQVSDLKSRLNVMNEVGTMLQLQVKEMERAAGEHQEKAMLLSQQLGELRAEAQEKERQADIKISDLEFKLTDAKRVLKSLLDKYNKAQKVSASKVSNLTKENDNLKERLMKAKQVVDHLQQSINETGQNRDDMDGKVMELESRLAQSARATKFLETSLVKTKEEKQNLDLNVKSLEAEIASLKTLVNKKEMLHQEEVSALKARVSIADRVGEFVKQNKALLGDRDRMPHHDSVTEDTASLGLSMELSEASYELEGQWVPLRY